MFYFIKLHLKLYITVSILILLYGCKGGALLKKNKPLWLAQRPVSNTYYVGVGYANKISNPLYYQQLAKKNALNDLVGEIKVNVSTNSILSIFENNKNINQQYLSNTKITAQVFVENFEVVDSWEDKNGFWIYYKLSKSEYETQRIRKIEAAIEHSLDLLNRSNYIVLNHNLIQSIQFKIKALVRLQDFFNEDLETLYNGKKVYLVNEIINQLQDQLSTIFLRANTPHIKAKAGKAIAQPFSFYAYTTDTNKATQPITGLPLHMVVEQGKMNFGASTQSDQAGIASFSVARVLAKDPVQLLRVGIDIIKFVVSDSLNIATQNILLGLTLPSTTISLQVEPIKVYMLSNESNISTALVYNILEPSIKKKLVEEGCQFVKKESDADYKITINSDTKSLGVMWGKMLQASIDMNISVRDTKNDIEIFKDAMQAIRGYQYTIDKAGLDAYNNAIDYFYKNIFPNMLEEILVKDH